MLDAGPDAVLLFLHVALACLLALHHEQPGGGQLSTAVSRCRSVSFKVVYNHCLNLATERIGLASEHRRSDHLPHLILGRVVWIEVGTRGDQAREHISVWLQQEPALVDHERALDQTCGAHDGISYFHLNHLTEDVGVILVCRSDLH